MAGGFFTADPLGKPSDDIVFSKIEDQAYLTKVIKGFPSGSVVKNPPAVRELRRHGFDPWVGKTPWRRAWQPTPVFLPGKSHGQRSLVSYSLWDLKELDMIVTEHA